jgi:hypothetical protein
MVRLGTLVAFAFVVFTTHVSAADTPEVAAMKQQVKTLKAQKTAAAKAIHAQYDTVIGGTKLDEAKAAAARKQFAEQEKEIDSLGASTPEAKAARENLDALRKAMFHEGVMDGKQIAALRAQRTTHVNASNAAYDAKIKALEAQIKAAPKSTAAAKTKPK